MSFLVSRKPTGRHQDHRIIIRYQRLSEADQNTIRVSRGGSISDVKKEIGLAHHVDRSLVDILSDGMIMENDALIREVHQPLQVVIHLLERNVPPFYESRAEDVINRHLEDDPTWEMSCGHAITPENLFGYCWSKLKDGEYKFYCPGLDEGCGLEWNFYEVTWKARLNDDERIYFESRISSNYLRKKSSVRECPFCRTLCERLSSGNPRVVCSTCTAAGRQETEFCWICLMPWYKGHFCGQDRIRHALETCETRPIGHAVNAPSIRLCVKCGLILEHTSGCKQMTCKCGQQFCFVCLTPCKPNGSFQCKTECRVAARQVCFS